MNEIVSSIDAMHDHMAILLLPIVAALVVTLVFLGRWIVHKVLDNSAKQEERLGKKVDDLSNKLDNLNNKVGEKVDLVEYRADKKSYKDTIERVFNRLDNTDKQITNMNERLNKVEFKR